jgi:lysozyme family protein
MYVKSANRFNECVEATIGFEGEYSDHPNDSGGRTKYGITASTLESAKTKGWVPSNVTIKNLKLDHAKTIYKKGYWDVVKADSLPHPLDLIIFDMAVNHGVNSAIKLLQKTLNSMSGFNLVVDGIIGQKTMTAIDKLTNTDHLRCLCAHVLLNRVELYTSIIQGNKTQERFFKGWVVNRVVKLKQEVGL